MPRTPRGASLPVSLGRRVAAEFLSQSRNIPLVTARREFALPGLAAVRAAGHPRVSWVALFAKAYGLAARRHAVLRRRLESYRALYRQLKPLFAETATSDSKA